jgi:preprotein translocase subunit YajC
MLWLPLLGEGEGPPGIIQALGPMFPILLIMIVMFVFMGRANARQRREQAERLNNLKKNDKVVTMAGIIGVVVAIKEGEDEVTLRVDDASNTRIRVLKSSITRVTTEEQEKAAAAAAAAAAQAAENKAS